MLEATWDRQLAGRKPINNWREGNFEIVGGKETLMKQLVG